MSSTHPSFSLQTPKAPLLLISAAVIIFVATMSTRKRTASTAAEPEAVKRTDIEAACTSAAAEATEEAAVAETAE